MRVFSSSYRILVGFTRPCYALFLIFLFVVCAPALAWSQDVTPPAAITNLSASPGINGGDIDLSWTAPGNDGWEGMISSGTYRIKYSTYSAYSWIYTDYDIAISTSNVYPGENQYQTVTGLDEGTTYYFRIWTADEADNWSSLSNGATTWAQDIRPAAIIDLSASPGEIDQKVNLSWSAPGDDGSTGILTGEYRIDYATYTKTWNPTDYQISIPTSNVNPGDDQYREVLNLTVGATYYFHIWTRDEVPDHWSEISNEATTWAPAIPPAAVTDLEAISGATEGSINLSWTAPTEDGAIGGKVSSYILKYATFSVNGVGDTTVWWNHPQTLTGLDEGSPKEPGETETFIVGGLSPGNTYYFAIKSRDDVGAISPIDTKTASFNQANAITPGDDTPPAAITTLSAIPGTEGGAIDLSWKAPGDDGVTGTLDGEYRIDYATYTKSWNLTDYEISILASGVDPGDAQSFTVTGLKEGATYYFRIWTADDASNWSEISNGATTWAQDIRPAAIIDLSASPGEIDQKINLSWSAPGDDGTTGILTGEYRIDYATYTKSWNPTDYQISIPTSNVNPEDDQYREVSNLTVGATYYFHIWTRDEVPDHWSEISNEATTWAPAIPPAAVTDLEAISGATEGSINLSWTAPTEDGAIGGKVSSYILKYATFSVNGVGDTTVWWNHPQTLTGLDGGSPKEPGETETFIIGGLSPGNTYYFAIKSRDDLGSISPIDTKTASFNQVNAMAASDDTPPAAITTLSAIPGTEGGAIDLSWRAPGDDGVTGTLDGEYRIDYATYTKSWNLTDYEISILASGVNPGDAQSFTVTGLKEGATYYFRIWTADDVSNWSEISNGATTWAQDIRPAAIINLSASPGEIDQKINLSWSAPGDDGNSGILTGEYRIDYATYTKTWNPTDYQISIPTSNVNPGDDQYWEVSNLTVGATYYFRIWTRDEVPNHWSEISNEATTWAPAIPPAAVTDLEAISGTTEGSINLSWTAPREDGAIGGKVSSYVLKYATFSVNDVGDTTVWWNYPQTLTGLDGGSPKEPGEAETFVIGGLSPGNTYYFAIKSRDDLGSISPIDTKTASFNQANAMAASIAPADITDLVAEPGGYDRIDLSWTAPGDDGWQGTATKYTIKYATYVINAANFQAVADVKERSVTVSGGSSDSETVTGLMAYTTYYFAIKTQDKVGNVSGISNIASAETGKDSLPPREPVGIRGILSADGETMTISWHAVTENEDGDGTPCKDLKGYNVYRAPIVDGDYVEEDFVARGESLVWTDPENIKGQIFYYMVKAKDTSGNLSRSSMIADSSVDMNIIAVSGEDGSTRIVIPKEIGQILYKETNSYGEDVIMEVLRDKEEDERVIKSCNFIARGEKSGKEIKDFVFAKPLARIALAYEVENGYVKQASSVPEKLASEQLALFWFNGLEWIKLGGEVDEYFHLVSVMSKRIGKYMIRISFRGSSFGIQSIQPDKIFTPNGDGWNDYIEIHYANPKDAFVNGKIYDVRGALVAEMEKGAKERTLIWNGKDTNGDTVAGGVYIYQIQVVGAENKVINGTVVVAR